MREYIPKEEVLEIIRDIPSDLHKEYIYELDGIWIDEESGDMSKWIPVSERLPEDNRDVLMCLEWGIDIGTYDRGEWRSEWINHYDDDGVIAWMPLPEPYRGSEG